MSAQSYGRRTSAADAVEVSSVFGQLCCLTLDTRRAARQGEPEKEMANCERAAGKRESHFFAPGARAPAPRAIGERANTDWRSVSAVRSVFARSPKCRQTLSGGRAKDGKEPTATQSAEGCKPGETRCWPFQGRQSAMAKHHSRRHTPLPQTDQCRWQGLWQGPTRRKS